MPLEVRVDFDVTALAATLSALSSPRLERAASAALNDTAKNAQVQATKTAAPLLGLPSRDLKAAMRLELAAPTRLQAAVIASGRPIPLIRFKAKDQRPGGVIVSIARKQEVYRRAFIATMGSGYRAVWERTTAARHPVKQLYGPSIPGIIARDDVLGVVTTTMNTNLLKNLQRQVDRQLRSAAGLGKGSR